MEWSETCRVVQLKQGSSAVFEREEAPGVALHSGKRDSNPQPSAWEADALPTEQFQQDDYRHNALPMVRPQPSRSLCQPPRTPRNGARRPSQSQPWMARRRPSFRPAGVELADRAQQQPPPKRAATLSARLLDQEWTATTLGMRRWATHRSLASRGAETNLPAGGLLKGREQRPMRMAGGEWGLSCRADSE